MSQLQPNPTPPHTTTPTTTPAEYTTAAGIDLSVIVPLYREQDRIGRTLDDLLPALARGALDAEVILVDDGSDDATAQVVQPRLSRNPIGRLQRVSLFRHDRNRGKGAAVRTGLANARGRWRLMMDADNATSIDQADRLLDEARRTGAALVVGSRARPDSVVRTRVSRRLIGSGFRLLVRALGVGLVSDTQCGFKVYRADAADLVVQKGIEDGFAFDVEHLLLVHRSGLGIAEVGITWTHRDGGQVRPLRDGLAMLAQAWRIRRRLGAARAAPVRSDIESRDGPQIRVRAAMPSIRPGERVNR